MPVVRLGMPSNDDWIVIHPKADDMSPFQRTLALLCFRMTIHTPERFMPTHPIHRIVSRPPVLLRS